MFCCFLYREKCITFLHMFIVTCTFQRYQLGFHPFLCTVYTFFIFVYIQIYFLPRINKAFIHSLIHSKKRPATTTIFCSEEQSNQWFINCYLTSLYERTSDDCFLLVNQRACENLSVRHPYKAKGTCPHENIQIHYFNRFDCYFRRVLVFIHYCFLLDRNEGNRERQKFG